MNASRCVDCESDVVNQELFNELRRVLLATDGGGAEEPVKVDFSGLLLDMKVSTMADLMEQLPRFHGKLLAALERHDLEHGIDHIAEVRFADIVEFYAELIVRVKHYPVESACIADVSSAIEKSIAAKNWVRIEGDAEHALSDYLKAAYVKRTDTSPLMYDDSAAKPLRVDVVGDGPNALGLAYVLLKKRFGKTSPYRVRMLTERDGLYVRSQVLRFDHVDYVEFAKRLFGVELAQHGGLVENAAKVSRHMAHVRGKSYERDDGTVRQYVSANVSGPGSRSSDLYYTQKIKHIEQTLFAQLKAVNTEAGDLMCEFVNKKRVHGGAGAEAIKDMGALKAVYADGSVRVESPRDNEVSKPHLLVAADGAGSNRSGVLSAVRKVSPSSSHAFEFIPCDTEYDPTKHEQHSVAVYALNKTSRMLHPELSVEMYLDAVISRTATREQKQLALDLRRGELDLEIEPPTVEELRSMGWTHYAPPTTRFFRAKDAIYLAPQVPDKIASMADPRQRQERLERWHRLLLRYHLPRSVIEHYSHKGDNYAKPGEDVEKALRRRKLRERVSTGLFKVKVEDASYCDRIVSRLNGTIVLGHGDTVIGEATHHHTATGLWFGFKCLVELDRLMDEFVLGEISEQDMWRAFERVIQPIYREKHRRTQAYQRAEFSAERRHIEDARDQIVRAVGQVVEYQADHAELAKGQTRLLQLLSLYPDLLNEPIVPDLSADFGTMITPLMALVRYNVPSVVESLLELPNINLVQPVWRINKCAFHYAIEHNALPARIITRLIPAGTNVINLKTIDGDTALHLAVKQSNDAVIAQLCALGADRAATNGSGQTPLALAVQLGTLKRDTLRQLLGSDAAAEFSQQSGLKTLPPMM